MPSTTDDVFAAAGLTQVGTVKWGTAIPEKRSGVYVVSLSEQRASCGGSLLHCPLSVPAVQQWLKCCPDLLMDGTPPTAPGLVQRLSHFWLPDEVIVYVGLATSLRNRVRQYYNTPLGARRPHAGGYFLKTLNNLHTLFVHYATTDDPDGCEQAMLGRFCLNVSAEAKTLLHDPVRPFPFANLEHPPGTRKLHGLAGARA